MDSDSLGSDLVLLMGLSSEGGSIDFFAFLDSLPKQVADNITHSRDKVVDDTTIVIDVTVEPSNHLTRVSQQQRHAKDEHCESLASKMPKSVHKEEGIVVYYYS